jgi:DNA-binding NtrC family response regulator
MAVRTILILEDDAGAARLFSAALRAAGQETVVTSGFEEARKHLKESPPDALLTDVRVAEYNGLQLAILFRSLAPTAPILVVSGHDDPVIRKEVANISGAQFLAKPVDIEQLVEFFAR